MINKKYKRSFQAAYRVHPHRNSNFTTKNFARYGKSSHTRFIRPYISLNIRQFKHFVVTGLMNAADYYGLDELKCACSGFIQ